MKFKYTIPYIISAVSLCGMATGANADARENETTKNDSTSMHLAYAVKPSVSRAITETIDIPARPIRAVSHRRDVLYIWNNGDTITRKSGTRAWRNNNPGNLRHGKFTRANGAIGECGGFAGFPDAETGMDALCNLLMSDSYRNLTMTAAIRKYAPPSQNNVALYLQKLKKLTGLPTTTKLSSLSPQQLIYVAQSIRAIEGWREGNEIVAKANNNAFDTTYMENEVKNFQTMRDSAIYQNTRTL